MSPRTIQPVRWKKFEKFVLASGFVFERQKGSHRVYKKPDTLRPVIIPAHPYDVPVGVIRSNLRTMGISSQEYTDWIIGTRKKKRR